MYLQSWESWKWMSMIFFFCIDYKWLLRVCMLWAEFVSFEGGFEVPFFYSYLGLILRELILAYLKNRRLLRISTALPLSFFCVVFFYQRFFSRLTCICCRLPLFWDRTFSYGERWSRRLYSDVFQLNGRISWPFLFSLCLILLTANTIYIPSSPYVGYSIALRLFVCFWQVLKRNKWKFCRVFCTKCATWEFNDFHFAVSRLGELFSRTLMLCGMEYIRIRIDGIYFGSHEVWTKAEEWLKAQC